MRNRRTLLAAFAVATALMMLGGAPAYADAGIGLHEVSKASGADVHDGPSGLYLGHLYYQDKFDTTSHGGNGVWCTGHAYGHVHQDGSVLCADLKPSHW